MKTWIVLLVMYAAPPSAVNWDGPWTFGLSRALEKTFSTEAACRNYAIQFMAQMHQGMLAPMRYRCVDFVSSLPKGAAR